MNFFKKDIYIPIGSHCEIASYLRHIGYRKEAFPFDWTVTPIQSAMELINNDFEDFLKKDNLVFLEPTNRLLFKENGIDVNVCEDIITPVFDKKYHILFVHDFSKDAENEYDIVKEKYLRRVERLKEILKDKTIKINLIYDNKKPNEWQEEQYQKANYIFNTLVNDELNALKVNRQNIQIISFDKFKKNTKFLKLVKSGLKKVGIR